MSKNFTLKPGNDLRGYLIGAILSMLLAVFVFVTNSCVNMGVPLTDMYGHSYMIIPVDSIDDVEPQVVDVDLYYNGVLFIPAIPNLELDSESKISETPTLGKQVYGFIYGIFDSEKSGSEEMAAQPAL
jgi:hypothetical protein